MSRYKQNDERIITLDDSYTIRVWWEKTRYGFRHLATLSKCWNVVCRNKCCYYNRTWEGYQYESVIHGLIRKHFNESDAEKYKVIADTGGKERSVGVEKDCSPLRNVAALGGIAVLLSNGDKDIELRLKKAAISTIPGIDFPADFDALPADERMKRLDAILNIAKG